MRRHAPNNVRDPRTDGYTIVVHPCQEIILSLTNPEHMFKDATLNDKWNVELTSDYCYLSDTKIKENKTEYKIIQYYDLSNWVEQSSLHIGEIKISTRGKGFDEKHSLFIVAKKASNHCHNILTIVNPKINRIKLDIHEILEVVICRHEEVANESAWAALYDVPCGEKHASEWFEKLRQETILFPNTMPFRKEYKTVYGMMVRDVASLPRNKDLPRNKELPPINEKILRKQYHFWFRINPKEKSKIIKENTGKSACNIVFGSNGSTCLNVEVMVNTRGTVIDNVSKEEYDKVSNQGQLLGLVGKYYSPKDSIFINPTKNELIEFPLEKRGILLELAPPYMLDSQADVSARWQYAVEPVVDCNVTKSGGMTTYHRLQVVEHSPRSINCKPIQRFWISSLEDEIPADKVMLYLGVVKFYCSNNAFVNSRVVSFWLTNKPIVEPEQEVEANYTSPAINRRRKKNNNGGGSSSYSSNSKGYHYNSPPAAPYKPKNKKKVVISQYNDDSIIVSGASHTLFCNIQGSKKAEASIVEYDNQENHGKKKEGENKSGEEKRESQSPTSRDNNGPKDNGVFKYPSEVVLEMPFAKDVIVLKPGQTGVIRFPIKTWSMLPDIENFWCINSIYCLNDQRFYISKHSMYNRMGNLFQEIRVSLCSNKPSKIAGKFYLGAIRAVSSTMGERLIAIRFHVEDEHYSIVNPEWGKVIRDVADLMQEISSRDISENNKKKKSGRVILTDPNDQEELNLTTGESVEIVLYKKAVAFQNSSDILKWHPVKMPHWINMLETRDTCMSTTYIFEVDKSCQYAVPDAITFSCGNQKRAVKVSVSNKTLGS